MKLREVKSFVLRAGKITPGQQRALNDLLPIYGIKYTDSLINLNHVFARDNPKIIEIGFGMGKSTAKTALDNPDLDYVGIEVHPPGVGSILMEIEEHKLNNLKVIRHDAVKVIHAMIMDNSILGFHIFFPDPWHKKRHHKRRIIQTEFIELLVDKLIPGGYIHLATDWEDYAQWMLDMLNANSRLVNTSIGSDYVDRPITRPQTKFEERGVGLGHGIWDLIFKKIS